MCLTAGVLVSPGCSDLCHQLNLRLDHAPLARATMCGGLSLRELPARGGRVGGRGDGWGGASSSFPALTPSPSSRLQIWPERGKQFPQPGSQDSDSEMSLVRGFIEAFIYLFLGGQQGRASPWAAVKPRLQQVPRGILKLGRPPRSEGAGFSHPIHQSRGAAAGRGRRWVRQPWGGGGPWQPGG